MQKNRDFSTYFLDFGKTIFNGGFFNFDPVLIDYLLSSSGLSYTLENVDYVIQDYLHALGTRYAVNDFSVTQNKIVIENPDQTFCYSGNTLNLVKYDFNVFPTYFKNLFSFLDGFWVRNGNYIYLYKDMKVTKFTLPSILFVDFMAIDKAWGFSIYLNTFTGEEYLKTFRMTSLGVFKSINTTLGFKDLVDCSFYDVSNGVVAGSKKLATFNASYDTWVMSTEVLTLINVEDKNILSVKMVSPTEYWVLLRSSTIVSNFYIYKVLNNICTLSNLITTFEATKIFFNKSGTVGIAYKQDTANFAVLKDSVWTSHLSFGYKIISVSGTDGDDSIYVLAQNSLGTVQGIYSLTFDILNTPIFTLVYLIDIALSLGTLSVYDIRRMLFNVLGVDESVFMLGRYLNNCYADYLMEFPDKNFTW